MDIDQFYIERERERELMDRVCVELLLHGLLPATVSGSPLFFDTLANWSVRLNMAYDIAV